MKYQIYLKKEVSETINRIAVKENKKPSTLIKSLIESMFRLTEAVEKELKGYEKSTK